MIDPGHGGDEQGTQGAGGLLEKDLVLDVARRLRSVLDGRLGIRVLLTRDDDRLVPHDERASIANNNKADLFISLHANSSPNKSAKGAEVFYLSLDGLGDEARKMAESPEAAARPGARRRLARHRPHPVGHGPGPAPDRVGGVRRCSSRRNCGGASR